MIKIIFLDCDGVLNDELTEDRCNGYIGLEAEYLNNLKKIVDATGAEIVLSSTWRLSQTHSGRLIVGMYEYLEKRLLEIGLKIKDITPDMNGNRRGYEIIEWINNNKVDRFVVLDDCFYIGFDKDIIVDHWVETSFYCDYINTETKRGGLQEDNVRRAITILNRDVEMEYDEGGNRKCLKNLKQKSKEE